MPHHKSAEKRLKTNEQSRQRNLAVKSNVRKQLKKQRGLEGAAAQSELPSTYRELDVAVRKGVIPKARASRLKARTAKASKQAKS